MRTTTSNKTWRGHALGIAFGIMMLVLLLACGAVAQPYAYITNFGSNNVSVIDTATNNVTATVNVGNHPYGVAVKPDGTRVYVTNSGSNNVSVIDTATNNVTASVSAGNIPWGVAVNPEGTKVYVTNNGGNTVSVIDTATNNVTATVNVGNNPWGVAVKPDGTRVYVTNYGSDNISVIDAANNTVIATVSGVTSTPKGVAVNPAGTKVYAGVQTYGNGTISVIDTATNNITAIVNVGDSPTGIAIKPDGTRVYVANSGPGYGTGYNVSVIDTANNTVTAIVNMGSNSTGVAINPTGTKVYVANSDNNTVSVIDTATNNITEVVNVGSVPAAFGQFIVPAGAQTNISSCTDITMPGKYTLNQDIIHSANSVCINITSSDVIFDGMGHIIDGSGSYPNGTIGIVAEDYPNLISNVTVENTTLTNWEYGIIYEAADNGNVTNNNMSSNNYGISMFAAANNMLLGNNASSNLIDGIFIGLTINSSLLFSNDILEENTINSNPIGVYIDTVGSNTLNNNAILNNGIGVYSFLSKNNTLDGNNFSNNNLSIYLGTSNSTSIKNNNVSNNFFGISIQTSSGNIIYNNIFNNSINNAIDNGNNIWNISETLGTNIIGGPYLGGNFWSNYLGNDTSGDRIGDTLIPYNNSGNIANGGDFLPLTMTLGVVQTITNSGGGTVTSDTSGIGTSQSNPVITSITSPNSGTVTIQISPTTETAPTGFSFLNQQVDISAPSTTSSEPLTIVFTIDFSQIPTGQTQDTIQIFKNNGSGTAAIVPKCTGTGTATPDPCVSTRMTLANGDIQIIVLSSNGDPWIFAFPVPILMNVTKDFRFANVNFTATPAQLGTLLPQNGSKYNVTYVTQTKSGTVSSTNPGQLYGVITVNGTGVANVTVNDTFSATSGTTQFEVSPAQLDGGVEVLRVNTATGNAVVITDTPQVTSATINNTAGTVNLTVNLSTPLARDENLMIYIKFMTSLKGSLPNLNDFVNRADAVINGSPGTASAIINFV